MSHVGLLQQLKFGCFMDVVFMHMVNHSTLRIIIYVIIFFIIKDKKNCSYYQSQN